MIKRIVTAEDGRKYEVSFFNYEIVGEMMRKFYDPEDGMRSVTVHIPEKMYKAMDGEIFRNELTWDTYFWSLYDIANRRVFPFAPLRKPIKEPTVPPVADWGKIPVFRR